MNNVNICAFPCLSSLIGLSLDLHFHVCVLIFARWKRGRTRRFAGAIRHTSISWLQPRLRAATPAFALRFIPGSWIRTLPRSRFATLKLYYREKFHTRRARHIRCEAKRHSKVTMHFTQTYIHVRKPNIARRNICRWGGEEQFISHRSVLWGIGGSYKRHKTTRRRIYLSPSYKAAINFRIWNIFFPRPIMLKMK